MTLHPAGRDGPPCQLQLADSASQKPRRGGVDPLLAGADIGAEPEHQLAARRILGRESVGCRTQQADDEAAVSAGMEEKSLEFRKAREIYIPVKN